MLDEMAQTLRQETRVQAGDFEAEYAAGWSPVFRYCLTLVRDRDEAEDVAAEAFRRAYMAWEAGRGPAGETLPWLFLIARRLVIDRHRRLRLMTHRRLNAPRHQPGHDDPIRRSETWLWFEQLCAVLPDKQREALVLRYHFDLPDAAIGRLMGMSPAAVRSTVSRALTRLRNDSEVFR